MVAENTDAEGLLDSLPETPAGTPTLVLGAGGSARAAVWALVRAGADVEVWNRTESRARELATEMGARLASERVLGSAAGEEFELLVNCTTVGLQEASDTSLSDLEAVSALKALPIEADALSRGKTVVDLVYGKRETPLVAAARAGGAVVVDGLEILVRQGARSLQLWTGLTPPVDVMRRAAREAR